MSPDQEENWVSFYRSDLIELEHAKMSGRIADARTAIVARIEKLHGLPGLHAKERQLIEDALRILRFLEREEEDYQAGKKRRAVEEALKKLRSIAPAIQRLDDKDRPK